MLILLTIIELLQLCAECLLRWFRAPVYPRHGHKLPQGIDADKHRHSPRKPEWLKTEILRLKALMPQAGCRTIADICNRRFAASRQVSVGKTYVHYVLQRHDYEIQILRRKLKHAKPKPVARNLIWAIDLTGKTDAHGKLHSLFGIIDHGSRALLHMQALHDKTSRTLIASIVRVIRAYGKPRIIRTDNEAIFTSRQFRLGLERLGIRHQRTIPGCPWQNGRVERLFGTLKQVLDQWIVTGIEQLNIDLGIFRYWYNHVRPHQNLDGRTPAEAWSGTDPHKQLPKKEHWFEAWDGLLSGYYLRY
ncbi:integrase core domain-containing protein [Candidatus Ferrigenium straubiae]|jgi:transposase InsO family protein|uniref:integrase core domain-containing protein n=1 Tax=Candidatus Ferrigenium straubiae TaxID=2919506 RepID=UPI003F4AE355